MVITLCPCANSRQLNSPATELEHLSCPSSSMYMHVHHVHKGLFAVIFCCLNSYHFQLHPSQLQQRKPYQVLCAIGGWDGQLTVQSVEWYHPDIALWKQGAPLTQPRKRLAVTSLGGKVYAIGGHDGKNVLSSVEVFDQTTEQWAPVHPMNQARMFAACVTIDGKIYVIGGQCKLCVPLDSAEVFDPEFNRWQYISSMHHKVGSPIAIAHKKSLYVLGKAVSDLHIVQIYNLSTDTWTQVKTTIPYCRYASAVYHTNTMYILCGRDSCRHTHEEKNCDVYCYYPESNQWSTECQMPTARAGFAAAVVNGNIVVVGGHRGREKLCLADLYDPVAREWHPLPAMNEERCVLGAASVEKIA